MKPTAVFEWRMPSRARGWIKAWDVQSATYDKDYVSPQRWSVILDATDSEGGGFEITNYHWEITGLDGIQFSLAEDSNPATLVIGTAKQPPSQAKLAAVFVKILRDLGKYRVTLTVTNKNGEKSDPVTEVIELQDLLVVSMGDSMASGEGNPDTDKMGGAAAKWTDLRCHRSGLSGHALAAIALEEEHRSITFLSFACSGAGTFQEVLGQYDGFVRPPGDPEPLPSQAIATGRAIGSSRKVDLLLITVGINDVGPGVSFANFLVAVADPRAEIIDLDPAEAKARVIDNLRFMPDKYNMLAWGLSRRLHGRVRQTFITEYPAHIFQPNEDGKREGCGNLRFISDSDGDFIFERGQELNTIIRQAAEFHGWHSVTGIQKAFEGHGYCAGDEGWYVTREQSMNRLGTQDGTIHPKAIGHRAIRDRITETFRSTLVRRHDARRVTVIFESVQVLGLVDKAGGGKPPMTAKPVVLGANGQRNEIGPIAVNQAVGLPEKDFTFTFFVNDGLAGPLVAVTGNTLLPELGPVDQQKDPSQLDNLKNIPAIDQVVPVKLTQNFRMKENFGAGSHQAEVGSLASGGMKVNFRILVEDEKNIQPSFPGGTVVKTDQLGN